MARALDIELAVAMAEAQTGTHKPGQSKIALVTGKRKRHRFWTKEEEKFLVENLGKLSIQQIGRQLGRSWLAVVNHYKREMHLSVPSKDPRILTGEQVAAGLSKDGKSVHWMIDSGIMPGRRLAFDRQRVIRVVDKVLFLKWLLDPMNWCHFRPEHVGEMRRRGKRAYSNAYDQAFWDQAAKALRKARARWKDRWLTTGQLGKRLGVDCRNVNTAIRKRTLNAMRHANWWVLLSDVPKGLIPNALGRWVPRILSRQERGKKHMRKFWADVYAGRRPWPNIGGHNKKVEEKDKFFKLLGKKWDVLRAAARVKVSNPTAYKWLKERYGKAWQSRFAFTRESRKARFLFLFKKGHSVKKAADRAGVHVETGYKWLAAEWGKGWRKKARANRIKNRRRER